MVFFLLATFHMDQNVSSSGRTSSEWSDPIRRAIDFLPVVLGNVMFLRDDPTSLRAYSSLDLSSPGTFLATSTLQQLTGFLHLCFLAFESYITVSES